MFRTAAVFCLLILAFLLFAATAEAVPEFVIGPLNEQELDTRLDYTADVLQRQETSASYWEYGWGGFNGGTMIWSAVQASREPDAGVRATEIVQASESLIGLADVVLDPLPAFNADAVCDAYPDTEENRLKCLAAREALMERSAERANEPYEILPHLENAGFNLLAGLIVRRVGGTGRALTTAIPGEIIGELQLWTIPGGPMRDLEQYKVRFSPLVIQSDYHSNPAAGVMVSCKF